MNRFPVSIHAETGKEAVTWCINDYLGMAHNRGAVEAASRALEDYGVGSGGTRNICGTNSSIEELEKEISSLHSKDSALVFTSGYVANDTSLSTIAKIIPELVFFSDELNHASIVTGIRNSKAEKHLYKHLDISHLEELLAKVDISRPKLIVFESAYSMDGLFSDLKRICELAKKYNALTFIDEVHTVGLYGKGGAGYADMLGLSNEIDIIQGTLAKAYGAIGGYIAANTTIIDAIRLTASGFIFTTSLPPVISSAAAYSIKYLKTSDKERERHKYVVSKVKSELDKAKVPYLKNQSHIIPIIIGDPVKTRICSERLLKEHDIYVQHINFPTVPKGSERLRITPTPYHTEEMIRDLVYALRKVLKELDLT
jgi:5-aminolevulinate synthase